MIVAVLCLRQVALCGRTGCGKSSLFGVLLRLYRYRSGVIRINGVDMRHIPLERLRTTVRLLPQDPILVSGTLRENLAGFTGAGGSLAGDAKLWEVLELVGMKERVQRLPGRLDTEVRSAVRGMCAVPQVQ